MGTISQKIAKSYIANPKLVGPAEGRGVCSGNPEAAAPHPAADR